MCPGMNIHSSTWCVTRCHLWPTATSYHPIATTFLWLLTWCDQLPDVTCDQLWPEKSIDQFYCYHKCDNILSLTCCDKLLCDQMWPETRSDLLPGVTCDQLWPVTTPVTIFFPWFVLINCYRGMTRCDQLPSTICDQVWPVTRCDQLSGVTPPSCYHNSFVTSCQLPGHTPGHKPYPSGPKLDQDLSPREGFRSLGPKVKEE